MVREKLHKHCNSFVKINIVRQRNITLNQKKSIICRTFRLQSERSTMQINQPLFTLMLCDPIAFDVNIDFIPPNLTWKQQFFIPSHSNVKFINIDLNAPINHHIIYIYIGITS